MDTTFFKKRLTSGFVSSCDSIADYVNNKQQAITRHEAHASERGFLEKIFYLHQPPIFKIENLKIEYLENKMRPYDDESLSILSFLLIDVPLPKTSKKVIEFYSLRLSDGNNDLNVMGIYDFVISRPYSYSLSINDQSYLNFIDLHEGDHVNVLILPGEDNKCVLKMIEKVPLEEAVEIS